MLGNAFTRQRRSSSEAEKPFWISYADLMTAMMVLFLVAMAITIFAIRESIERPARERVEGIRSVCAELKGRLTDIQHIEFECDEDNNRISFGEAGRFALNSYQLPAAASDAIARMVPEILAVADQARGRRWISRVVVEGYTDDIGGYLYNLHLSLQRSEWVMCMLMDPRRNQALELNAQQIARVQELFVAGGVSFAQQRDTAEASRRVEMRIEFYPAPHVDGSTERARSAPPPDVCRL
jgi:outer membrane protein OmpA-like peptidoglycan-associated protein